MSSRSGLGGAKPAYTCLRCGEVYYFLIPSNCRKCASEIRVDERWAVYDLDKYQDFIRRVQEVGLSQASNELKD